MRILIADDHELVRDAISAFLARESDIDVDCADTFDDAHSRIESDGPYDVVILDYQMPGMNALDGLKLALRSNGGNVALISGSADKSVAERALAEGAAGFLPKTMAAKSLVHAVRFMAAGEQYAPIKYMTQDEEESSHPLATLLTRREFRVLQALCRGLSNKEIARELHVQEVTVKVHVKTTLRKLNARNRTQAAMIARDTGLF
ncbi:MAG: response regulator transcription factor [Pseudomonadota bacterium]